MCEHGGRASLRAGARKDFLKTAARRLGQRSVTRPDLHDPKLNKAYAESAAHYGCLIDPVRASKQKDEPRVERPMQ